MEHLTTETPADRARLILAGSASSCGYDFVAESDLIRALARDLIAETEAHEVTRGERDEACTDARACAALALTAQAERDQARAEVADLRREHDAAWSALGDDPGPELADGIRRLAGEVERLRVERAAPPHAHPPDTATQHRSPPNRVDP